MADSFKHKRQREYLTPWKLSARPKNIFTVEVLNVVIVIIFSNKNCFDFALIPHPYWKKFHTVGPTEGALRGIEPGAANTAASRTNP
jgi:hypothetical protein